MEDQLKKQRQNGLSPIALIDWLCDFTFLVFWNRIGMNMENVREAWVRLHRDRVTSWESGLYRLPPVIDALRTSRSGPGLVLTQNRQTTARQGSFGYSMRKQAPLKRCFNIRPSFLSEGFPPSHFSFT
jgi:hypothetical protein